MARQINRHICWGRRRTFVGSRSELLRQPEIVAPARSVLWRKHTNASPVPDDIADVKYVHDVKARCNRIPAGNVEFMRQAGVHLRIRHVVVGVEIAGAQAAAVDYIGGKAGTVPEI